MNNVQVARTMNITKARARAFQMRAALDEHFLLLEVYIKAALWDVPSGSPPASKLLLLTNKLEVMSTNLHGKVNNLLADL